MMRPEINDDRQLRALTGVSTEKRKILENAFGIAFTQEKGRVYQAQLAQGKPGGGQKGKSPTVHDKLIFLRYYLKVYPTFDVLGAQFDIAPKNTSFLPPVFIGVKKKLDHRV